MKEIIAYFKYKNITYYLAKYKNRIIFFKNDNHTLTLSLSKEEKTLLMNVYQEITPMFSNTIYIKDFSINNNKYSLYLDRNNFIYYWLPLNNLYNRLDNILLNFKYNHINNILYNDQQNNNESSKFIKRFIKIGTTFVMVLVTASLSANLFISPIIDDIKVENIKTTITKYSEPLNYSYDYREIEEVLENNENLSKEEKEYIRKLKFVFEDNYKYMDLSLIKERLRTLKINYGDIKGNAVGQYNVQNNEITIEAENIDKADKSVLIHELMHVFQIPGGHYLLELSNEFFTREAMIYLYENALIPKEEFLPYIQKLALENGSNNVPETEDEWLYFVNNTLGFGSGYNTHVGIEYILANILNEETLRKYQFNPRNVDLLANYLAELDGGKDEEKIQKAYRLLDSINDLRQYNEEIDDYEFKTDTKEVLEQLDYYYQKKNNISIYDDLSLNPALKNLVPKQRDNENYYKVLKTDSFLREELNTFISVIFPKTNLSSARKNTFILYFDHAPSKDEIKIKEMDAELQEKYADYVPKEQGLEMTISPVNSVTKAN